VEVEITEPPKDPSLLAGYSADVEIIVDRREGGLRIPTSAVRAQGGVLVLDEATGVIASRDIETGLGNWDQTEVTSGLAAGELVVLSLDKDGVEEGALAKDEQEAAP
jgi:HlyD family secretion protein